MPEYLRNASNWLRLINNINISYAFKVTSCGKIFTNNIAVQLLIYIEVMNVE